MSALAPPEPEALRAELRLAVAEAPDAAHDLVARALSHHLGSWPGMAPVDNDLLRRVADGCRYEAFLWVMGDRRWSQLADTLLGRIERRRRPAGPGDGRGSGNQAP